MTDMRAPSNVDFSVEEIDALDVWHATEPPADFADQVLLRFEGKQRRRPRWPHRLVLIAAAVVLVVLGAWLWVGSPVAGEIEAKERLTLAVGRRGVLVAEPGAMLRWSASRWGAARVDQPQGNVFYRVTPSGRPFVVETPLGVITVLGTCFRVEVVPMRASRAGLAGAAVGAATAAAVLVTVYEGRVLTATLRGRTEAKAGEVARLVRGQAPLVEGGDRRASSVAANAPADAPRPADTPTDLRERNQRLLRDADRLRAEVGALEAKVKALTGQSRSTKTFDLTPEELRAMADRCELRWDLPGVSRTPLQVSPKAREVLGLNPDEASLINRVLREGHQRFTQELRRLYVEASGDKNTDNLSPETWISEIEDKSRPEELKVVFQRLARERAGLQAPPADISATSVLERLYRLVTNEGDRLEKSIGVEIGPDLARRYREQGFNSRHRSSQGCPGGSSADLP